MGKIINHAVSFLIFSLCWIASASAATTQLPNGKQCFTGPNGILSSGSVNMFTPGTTTPKATWQDSGQVTANSNPIQLDANGCAIIYGIGTYRQQVFDGAIVSNGAGGFVASGNLIWDVPTTDPSSSNAVFWAGLSGGTPNAVTLVDSGFNATDGSVINWTALNTNTAATTVTINSVVYSIVKDTGSGPVALTGNEIIATNAISMVYQASSNTFHLLNNVLASTSGTAAALCGASNLKITNAAVSGGINITVTADYIMTQSLTGLTINRTNPTFTINITTGNVTSTANGMDGEAPGTSAWIDIFAIDNGTGIAGLVSLAAGNAKAPTLPSGYIYKCYIGAMRVGAGGTVLTTLQRGNVTSYVITAAGTVLALPTLVSGSSGSVTAPTWTAASVSTASPPTATQIDMVLQFEQSGAVLVGCMAAPDNNYGAYNSTTNPPPMVSAANSGTTGNFLTNQSARFVLESTNVYFASNVATCGLFAKGWVDAVNAN